MPPHGTLVRLAQSLRRPRRCLPLPFRQVSTAVADSSPSAQRTVFTPSVSRTGATSFMRSRSTAPHRIDLGNSITVVVAAQRKKRGRDKQKRPSAPPGAPSEGVPSNSRHIVAAVEQVKLKDTHQNVPADVSRSITHATFTIASPEGPFVVPHTGATAAALLDSTTMFEALSLPPSAVSFSLSVSTKNISPTDGDAAQAVKTTPTRAAAEANFKALQSTALPLLFTFAEEEQQQLLNAAPTDSGVVAPGIPTSRSSPARLTEIKDALRCLAVHLENIQSAVRRDGRRHIAALPPSVVAALWDRVMPLLHARALPRRSNIHEGHHPSGESVSGKRDEATTEDSEEAMRNTDKRKDMAELPLNVMSSLPPSLLKSSYFAVRRALALHTRSVAPLLPPDVLAMVLTRLYQCGALADDIVGPVITDWMMKEQQQQQHQQKVRGSSVSVGGTISALQQRVLRLYDVQRGENTSSSSATTATAKTTFTGAAAITMARLLGKASLPGHHQLHRFFHLALLPEVTRVLRTTATTTTTAVVITNDQHHHSEANGAKHVNKADHHHNTIMSKNSGNDVSVVMQPGVEALLDLTSAFRHYAVSGEAVEHLTTLWRVEFTHADPLSWNACVAVLRAVSTLPVASSRSQRRQARQLPHQHHHVGTRQDKLLLRVAEEDYFPLVEEVCARVRQLSEATVASIGSASPESKVDVVASTPAQLLDLLQLLLRVNSPHWADTYEALATAIFLQYAAQLSSSSASSSSSAAAATVTLLENYFPLSDTRRTLNALLHRNSLIPDHPLHRVLLRRLLYAPEALTDVSVAATALLGFDTMIPIDEGSMEEDVVSSSSAMQTSTALVHAAPTETFAITSHDRMRALQLLRRYGRSMSPTSFIAGLCVAPIQQMPPSTQAALVNHLSSIATAVSPVYLVKGISAVMRQLHPSALDAVSVRKWFSRFTAVDVVRQIDCAGCAALLDVLSDNPRFEQHCVLAKQAITRQIGVALLRAGNEDDGGSGGLVAVAARTNGLPSLSAASPYSLTLEQLPQVVSALRRANVFFPPYFSRVCRMLLGQVESAPLGDLLLPFSAIAEEFMRRQQREGQSSLFKDVWELLRGRVLDQTVTLSLEETCTALNAFAALDVGDSALFGVLVYHLWTCMQRAASALDEEASSCTHAPSTSSAATSSAEKWKEIREGGEPKAQEVRLISATDNVDVPNGMDNSSNEAQEARVRRVAHVGECITRALSPSAVAVVVTTLCARDEAVSIAHHNHNSVPSCVEAHNNHSGQGDSMVRTMLPWMLLELRVRHSELYPIDVVHLLPSLVQRYTAAAIPPSSQTSFGDTSERALLHAAYDACRSSFLSMYAVLPSRTALDTASATNTDTKTTIVGAKNSVKGSTMAPEEMQRIAAQRAEWTPAVKLSVQVVPRSWFATLLLALSSADLADVDVGLACVERACTRRVCSAVLPIDELVDVCLTMCWLFNLSDAAVTRLRCSDGKEEEEPTTTAAKSRVEGENAEEVSTKEVTQDTTNTTTPTTVIRLLRTSMATVLSSLWYRSDELNTAQIHALLRCLRDTYGADCVDADFVQRLEAQETLIQQRRHTTASRKTADSSSPTTRDDAKSASTVDAARAPVDSGDDNAATRKVPEQTELMQANDLFAMM